MYDDYNPYPCPYYSNNPLHNPNNRRMPSRYWNNMPAFYPNCPPEYTNLKDYGLKPLVVNIERAAKQNNNFRLALWTGKHFQITLMSIEPGEDIGLEMHPNVDQFLRIEEGQGLVKMGNRKNQLDYQRPVYDNYAIVIPAGKWHNLVNTGCTALKLYSIYAPPEHPHGTIHVTKREAEEQHR